MDSNSQPFNLESEWRQWAAGFAVFWFIEIAMVELGAGDLAVALALAAAGGATVVTIDAATRNLGLSGPAPK